jgi:hypothetical protein
MHLIGETRTHLKVAALRRFRLKQPSGLLIFFALMIAALAAVPNFAQAQRMDIAFGVSNVLAPGINAATTTDHAPVSLAGGAYPGFSGNVIFLRNVGVGAEVFWRASRADYAGAGFGFRPVLWNVNAVYSPRLARHAYLDLVGGIGALSTRFYTGTTCGIYSCSNYQSINHFDVDLGGGIKFYVGRNFFIRPEARWYLVNNNQEFSSNYVGRAGVSIGYTFR